MPKLLLPSALGRLAIRNWEFPCHIQRLQRAIIDLLYDPARSRLIVKMPVRHGKSWYTSWLLPAWYLISHPYNSIMVISYGAEFAQEWSGKIRDTVDEWGPKLTGVALDPNFKTRSHFRLAPPHTGELRGLGFGGGLAGKGGNLILVDDPNKEQEELQTAELREKLHRHFMSEVLTRCEPNSKIIIIQSSRHPEDLSGKLLETNPQLAPAQQWQELIFPAINDAGEALWPERWPIEKLLAIKRDHETAGTEHVWYSLYQQDPATAAEFCEWPSRYWDNIYYDELPRFTPRFRLMSLDPSMGKDRRKGDFQAMLHGLVDPGGTLWIDDPCIVRLPLTPLEDVAVAMVAQYHPDAFAIETNNFQELVAENIYKKAPAAPIYPYVSVEHKEVRIRMLLTPLLAQGKIRIKDTPQGRILGQQLRDFPLASHDDGPDSLALMVRLWNDLLGAPQEPAGDTHTPVFAS